MSGKSPGGSGVSRVLQAVRLWRLGWNTRQRRLEDMQACRVSERPRGAGLGTFQRGPWSWVLGLGAQPCLCSSKPQGVS